ncbi:MAG: DNA-directed RNA polymerase subunit alpha [Armatimonadota bacterium]|nr:DNA-directed RNA polymerase subunit alpha [Armatimonadota bacterium]
METIAPKIQPVRVEENYGRFVIEPLERGFGTTLGNSLRRVLLSSIPGAAITMVKIEGVQHEFSTIPGVVEDATDIILNLKNLAIRVRSNGAEGKASPAEGSEAEPLVLRIEREGEGEVTAADIEGPPEVEVVNRGAHIATLAKDGRLKMEMTVERGRGYVPAERQKRGREIIGEIAVASIFTPVPKVNYTVEPTRVGHNTDLDRLTLDIWTNGTINPREALSQAARILVDCFRLFCEEGEEAEGLGGVSVSAASRAARARALSTRIEDLDFSVRTSNCLRNQGIETLADLLEKTEAELLATRHFGKKSLAEVKEKLAQCGLSLKSGKPGEETAEESGDQAGREEEENA